MEIAGRFAVETRLGRAPVELQTVAATRHADRATRRARQPKPAAQK